MTGGNFTYFVAGGGSDKIIAEMINNAKALVTKIHTGALNVDGGPVAPANPLPTCDVPLGTPLNASSSGGAQANNCALGAAAGKTTYITGFEVTGAGATAASVISVTVTGTLGGTLTYTMVIPAGATVGVQPLIIEFPKPIPASAVNTAITVNVPSFGAGNTNASAVAHGFRI